jgi:hypothetical protein
MKTEQFQILIFLLIFFFIFSIVIVVLIISQWKIYEKAGKPGWAAIVPVYNQMVLAEIGGKPDVWGLLPLIPYVGIIWSVWLINRMAKSFGKDVGFTLGLIFLPLIFYPILAFGDSEYVGHPDLENIEATNSSDANVTTVLIDLKDAKNAQIMGVISLVLVFCTCCYGGLIAAILGYLAMKKGNDAIAEYEVNPGMYTEKSFNQAKTGKTTGLIGVIVGILALLYIVFNLVFGFASVISDMGRGGAF